MAVTSLFLSQFDDGAPARHDGDDLFDDQLFDAADDPPFREVQHRAVVAWLKESSAAAPEITEGLGDSIVSWFLQSAYLLPVILGLKSSGPPTDLTSTIRVLVQHKCLKPSTVSYLQKSCEHAPPPDLIWHILDDVYEFALAQRSVSVPLVRTKGLERPILLDQSTLSSILNAFGLPPFPGINELRGKSLAENQFRNGQFLLSVYCALEKIESVEMKAAASIKKSIQHAEKVLRMFQEKDFLDESFVAAAPLLVNGDLFTLQQILSNVFWNVSIETEIPQEKPDEGDTVVERNTLQDGVALPKLLAAIDPEFAAIECIFAEPEREAERKWNLRKSFEFLTKKAAWPRESDTEPSFLYVGQKSAVIKLFQGIVACYPSKFDALSSRTC
jgi:hypothetical protein